MDPIGEILKSCGHMVNNMVDRCRNELPRLAPLKHNDDMSYIESLITSKTKPFVLKKKYMDFIELTGMYILFLPGPSVEQKYDYVQRLYHLIDGYVILAYRYDELKPPFNNCPISRDLAISFITYNVWRDDGRVWN